jgi:hypothetical protein
MKPCSPIPFSLGLLALLSPLPSFAAACCGGGFAAPALIVGDDFAKVTASYAYSSVVSDVGADAYWRKLAADESSETLKLDAARVFWDSWQAGLSLPLVRRRKAGQSSTGLGDATASLGYEYLPDWDYNPWRPRGLGYLQLTAPTGKSVDEASAAFQLDSRGRGYWAAGLGTILTKIWGSWDAFVSLEGHRSFSREFRNEQFQGILHPGYGGAWGLGGGWNASALRLGASLTWSYEDPVGVTGTVTSPGSPQRFATAAVSASYLLSDLWAGTLTYADQTRFGAPTNTTLGRGVTLLVQRRWER